jgi:hypothetical protein
MTSVYKRTWAGQDGGERVRSVAVYAASPELKYAIERLLDGSFQPRVTKRRNPKQLELFTGRASLPRRPHVAKAAYGKSAVLVTKPGDDPIACKP